MMANYSRVTFTINPRDESEERDHSLKCLLREDLQHIWFAMNCDVRWKFAGLFANLNYKHYAQTSDITSSGHNSNGWRIFVPTLLKKIHSVNICKLDNSHSALSWFDHSCKFGVFKVQLRSKGCYFLYSINNTCFISWELLTCGGYVQMCFGESAYFHF